MRAYEATDYRIYDRRIVQRAITSNTHDDIGTCFFCSMIKTVEHVEFRASETTYARFFCDCLYSIIFFVYSRRDNECIDGVCAFQSVNLMHEHRLAKDGTKHFLRQASRTATGLDNRRNHGENVAQRTLYASICFMQNTRNASHEARNVLNISLSFFFIFFGFGTAQQYLTVLFREQGREGLALVSLLLLYGVFMATSIVVPKLIPFLGGLKKSLIIGACTYVLFVFSIALDNVPVLLAASVIIGVGAGLLWIASAQIISDSSSMHTVGRNLGLQSVGLYCGNILGIYAGGYMAATFSTSGMYLVLGVVTALGIVPLLAITPAKEEVKQRPFRFGYMLDRRMLAIFPLLFGSYYLLAQVFTGMNAVIVSLLGVGSLPFLISVVKLSNIAGSFGSGTLSGWMSEIKLLLALTLMALFGIGFFVMAQLLIPLLIAAVLLGFSMASIYPVTLTLLKDTLPAEQYLYAIGVFNFYNNFGVIVALAANGLLSASTSFIPGAVALFVAIPGLFLFKRFVQLR